MTEKEIVLRVLKIEKLLAEKRENDALSRYNAAPPLHYKQLEFHRCQKRNRWVFGGNRSGKTECGAVETVWLARGIHPYRPNRRCSEGWVVSLSQGVQKEVAQRKILKYLNPEWIDDITMLSGRQDTPENGVIDCITVKNVFGGKSRVWFKSCETGRAKFQGTSLDFVWFDEEPPEDIYTECVMRVMDKKGDIFGTMTPVLGRTFLYDRIYLNDRRDDEVWCEFMEWADNPFLDPAETQRLSRSMSEEELSCRRYGRFASLKGAVYPEFDENVHVIEPFAVPREWYDKISIDPGLKNPTSCHFYATDGERVFVIKEHYESGQPVEYHCRKIREMAASLGWPTDRSGRLKALIDSAAGQRTLAAEKSVSELFCENGIAVNSKVNKDVFSGISRVKSLLAGDGKKPDIYIFSDCVNMIREFKGYRWGDGESPVKRDDHAMDELRYYAMTLPKKRNLPREKSSPVALDKRRVYRWMKKY